MKVLHGNVTILNPIPIYPPKLPRVPSHTPGLAKSSDT